MQQLHRENNGSRAISKAIAFEFPGHDYSHTHIQKYLNNVVPFLTDSLVGQLGTVQPIVHMPHLAGMALPPSIISQYSAGSSVQSWPVDKGLEEFDNYSDMDWLNPMSDPTDAFQYMVPSSFSPVTAQVEDPPAMMLEAMKEVINAIPRIGINSMKNKMLNAVWRKFNPDPTPPQQPQDNGQSVEDMTQRLLAKYEESEKREKARQVLKEQKEQEERTKHNESMEKRLDPLRKKVKDLNKKTAPETIDPPVPLNEKPPPIITQPNPPNGKILDTDNSQKSAGSVEPADNPGKESLQEKTSTSQEHNQTNDSNGVSTVPPAGPDEGEKLKQPGDEEKNFPGLADNHDGPRLPSAYREADPSVISQGSESGFTDSSKPSMTTAPSTPPPPPASPNGQGQKSNGAPLKPEGTFLKAPSVNHNLRNQALTALVIVGIGVAALYIFNPQVRQWVFSQYVRIFHKASSQFTSDGTFIQPQQNSNAFTQGYARVNDPNGVAFF